MSAISFSQIAQQYELASQVPAAIANITTDLEAIQAQIQAGNCQSFTDGTYQKDIATLNQFQELAGGGGTALTSVEKQLMNFPAEMNDVPLYLFIGSPQVLSVNYTAIPGMENHQPPSEPLTVGLLNQLIAEGYGAVPNVVEFGQQGDAPQTLSAIANNSVTVGPLKPPVTGVISPGTFNDMAALIQSLKNM